LQLDPHRHQIALARSLLELCCEARTSVRSVANSCLSKSCVRTFCTREAFGDEAVRVDILAVQAQGQRHLRRGRERRQRPSRPVGHRRSRERADRRQVLHKSTGREVLLRDELAVPWFRGVPRVERCRGQHHSHGAVAHGEGVGHLRMCAHGKQPQLRWLRSFRSGAARRTLRRLATNRRHPSRPAPSTSGQCHLGIHTAQIEVRVHRADGAH